MSEKIDRAEIKIILRKKSTYHSYYYHLKKKAHFYWLIETAFIISASDKQEQKTVSKRAYLAESAVTERMWKEYKDLLIGCQVTKEYDGKGNNQYRATSPTLFFYPVIAWNKYLRLAFEDIIEEDNFLAYLEEIPYETD